MSEVNGYEPTGMRITTPLDSVSGDLAQPSTDDLVAAAIRMARGAGLSWVHINQVLAGRH